MSSARPVPPVLLGLAPLGAFAFFSVAVDVYAGDVLQRIDPMVLAAISFTAVALVSVAVNEARGAGGTWRQIRSRPGDVLAINVVTAVTWLSLLYALKYIEPAIANVVSIAIGPACTVLLRPLSGSGRVLRSEAVASGVILGLIGVLAWTSFAGHSAVADAPADRIAIGVAGAVVSGVASALTIIYSKRLSEAGLPPRSVMAVRYFAVIAITWPFAIGHGASAIGSSVLPALVVGVIGIAVPMYLLQVGIRHVEPVTAAMAVNLAPALTYLLQFFDGRLEQSTSSLLCIAGITVTVLAGMAARLRADRRTPVLATALRDEAAP